eukprot:g12621.t1
MKRDIDRDIDHDIEGTRIRKKNKNNDETTLHSNIVIGWKKTVASGEYKVKDDTSSAAGTVIVQGLSGKINKSIERHFLNTLPEEKKRFNLTAPKTETQQDTKLNIKTLWAPICLDLYMIKYLKKEYFGKNKRLDEICNYMAPLAFFQTSNVSVSRLYTRIYKQLPLRFCIRLSIFRWIANMIVSALGKSGTLSLVNSKLNLPRKEDSDKLSKNEVLNNIYVRCALQTTTFLDRLFENIPSRKDDADTDMDILSQIDQLNNSHHVKTRFSLSEYGQQMLSNCNKSFQPCVPHSIIPSIQLSLTSKNLLCRRKKTYLESQSKLDVTTKNLYTHEAKSLTNNVSLGAFPYELNELKSTRHSILIHLAGWPEGSAMFGLGQMFGTIRSTFFQNAIDSIFAFVDSVSTACIDSDDFEMLKKDENDNAKTAVLYSEQEEDLYMWMDNIFDYSSEEDSLEPREPSFDRFQAEIENSNFLEKNRTETTICRAGYMNAKGNKVNANGSPATNSTTNEVSISLDNAVSRHVVSDRITPNTSDSGSKLVVATTNVTQKQPKSMEKHHKSWNNESNDKATVINTTLSQSSFDAIERSPSNYTGTVKFYTTEAPPTEDPKAQNRRVGIWSRCTLWMSCDYVLCRIKYPNPSIIELKLLLANNRFYQKLAFGMFVQCLTAGILAGVFWREHGKQDMAFFAASRVLLILSLLSLVGGIRAACMSSFFSRLVYECECNDAKTEIEKQKSIDA